MHVEMCHKMNENDSKKLILQAPTLSPWLKIFIALIQSWRNEIKYSYAKISSKLYKSPLRSKYYNRFRYFCVLALNLPLISDLSIAQIYFTGAATYSRLVLPVKFLHQPIFVLKWIKTYWSLKVPRLMYSFGFSRPNLILIKLRAVYLKILNIFSECKKQEWLPTVARNMQILTAVYASILNWRKDNQHWVHRWSDSMWQIETK